MQKKKTYKYYDSTYIIKCSQQYGIPQNTCVSSNSPRWWSTCTITSFSPVKSTTDYIEVSFKKVSIHK
jgi:hypothetical protein